MIVRRAVLQDAPALAELGATTFTETFGHLYSAQNLALHLQRMHSQELHAAVVQDPDTGVWIAIDETGYAIGYAVAGRCKLPVRDLEPQAGELKQIYVRASNQKAHLGSKLMSASLAWLEERYSPLYVGVWSENAGAQRLYARYGFERVGEYRFQVGEHFDEDFIFRRPASWSLSPQSG